MIEVDPILLTIMDNVENIKRKKCGRVIFLSYSDQHNNDQTKLSGTKLWGISKIFLVFTKKTKLISPKISFVGRLGIREKATGGKKCLRLINIIRMIPV